VKPQTCGSLGTGRRLHVVPPADNQIEPNARCRPNSTSGRWNLAAVVPLHERGTGHSCRIDRGSPAFLPLGRKFRPLQAIRLGIVQLTRAAGGMAAEIRNLWNHSPFGRTRTLKGGVRTPCTTHFGDLQQVACRAFFLDWNLRGQFPAASRHGRRLGRLSRACADEQPPLWAEVLEMPQLPQRDGCVPGVRRKPGSGRWAVLQRSGMPVATPPRSACEREIVLPSPLWPAAEQDTVSSHPFFLTCRKVRAWPIE